MSSKNSKFETKLIHSGAIKDQFGAVVTPIYQSSTFSFEDANDGADKFAKRKPGYIYTRIGNPTIQDLEDAMADLENGYGGIAVASGMAAVNLIYMGFLKAGDHIVASEAVYGPSRVVLEKFYTQYNIESTFVDTSDPDEIKNAFKSNTTLLYIETPTNPTMVITDLEKAAKMAHKRGIVVAVDNTFSSPYLQKPLDLGCDIVLHSITKFINGHADVVGGVVVAKTKEHFEQLNSLMILTGANMDPHQAYLVRRGLKTLSIRMERAEKNAMKIAEFLESHPKVEWVSYPGLKSHPQHELAKKQMSGFGALMSFEVKGGLSAGKIIMDNVEIAVLAVSLGGIETLIQHPASMTHAAMSKESKLEAGITDGLVRLSVGIEDAQDLISDLEQALEKV
jgi:methionine-gamma-lyase